MASIMHYALSSSSSSSKSSKSSKSSSKSSSKGSSKSSSSSSTSGSSSASSPGSISGTSGTRSSSTTSVLPQRLQMLGLRAGVKSSLGLNKNESPQMSVLRRDVYKCWQGQHASVQVKGWREGKTGEFLSFTLLRHQV